LKQSGDANQRKYAKAILPLAKRHHLLLVTLLITNACANEALPIFLEKVVAQPYIAIIVSVTMVLFFGEIIPQAICSRYGLAVGYYFSIPMWILIGIEFVIAYPISILLDCILGKEHINYFRRSELKELVKLHGEKDEYHETSSILTEDEVKIIRGALTMQEKTVKDVITLLDDVFSLPLNAKLDQKLFDYIAEKGHSRIPIYRKDKNHIIGIILVKNLINIDLEEKLVIDDLQNIIRIPNISSTTPLYLLLNQFINGRSHMACVLDEKDNLTVIGIVTLEDVIESLLDTEIYDETDVKKEHFKTKRNN